MQSGLIYLIGPSGTPNFGDEFIAAAWLRYLAVERPDAEVRLHCPQPGLAQVLFDGLHPRSRVTNTLWRLVHENADVPIETSADTIRARVTGLGSPSYDLGLLIAGSRIARPHGRGLHQRELVAPCGTRRRHARPRPDGCTTRRDRPGLMPLVTSAPAEMPLFQVFSHATARDEAGAAAYGVDRGLDDAFLGVAGERPAPGERLRSTCVSKATPPIRSGSRQPSRWRACRGRWTCPRGPQGLLHRSHSRWRPRGLRAMADLIPEERFLPFSHIWTHGLPLSDSQTWITSRFHFHLLLPPPARAHRRRHLRGLLRRQTRVGGPLGSGWSLAMGADEPGVPAAPRIPAGRRGGARVAEARRSREGLPPGGRPARLTFRQCRQALWNHSGHVPEEQDPARSKLTGTRSTGYPSWHARPTTLLLLAVFFLPGTLALLPLRTGWPAAVALGPAVTLLLYMAGTFAAAALHLPWNPATAVGLAVPLVLLPWLIGRRMHSAHRWCRPASLHPRRSAWVPAWPSARP